MTTTRLLRMREVMERTSLGKSTIYRKIAAQIFPPPVSLGGAAVRWRESDIDAWVASLRARGSLPEGRVDTNKNTNTRS
jgi:prophage regulatory protein